MTNHSADKGKAMVTWQSSFFFFFSSYKYLASIQHPAVLWKEKKGDGGCPHNWEGGVGEENIQSYSHALNYHSEK